MHKKCLLNGFVAFFSLLGECGLLSASMYYLKAETHFDKDQFAELDDHKWDCRNHISSTPFMPFSLRYPLFLRFSFK
nr:kinesin-like protein KIN-7K, chloroplastic isoform X1 [Tanacetum cinerariifolium]